MTLIRRGGVFLVLGIAALLRAQQPWTATESPTTRTLWGLEYGDNLFVAVGEGGTIITSTDGLAWTARTSGTDRWLLAVVWSRTVKAYVAVGDAGTILTSPNGITWTPRASGTTQRLNSVAWAPKRFTYPDVFLAVGENGTALVSYDLATWSPRATGDSGWLRGITTSPGSDIFIVTGHDGTILTTEDAGETFERRASGTTLHLDAVTRFGQDEYYATGSNFVLARSRVADYGRTWTLDRTVNTDGRDNGIVYNGLVPFNNALVIVGDQGRIIDEAGRPWSTTEPLFPGWRAVAASHDRVVAVGTSGGIASAPVDPPLGLEHTISTSFLIDSIVLNTTRRRVPTEPFQLQWYFNGQPIAGATGTTLTLNTLAGAQNGTYSLTATTISGSTSSTASVTLDPQPNPPALGLVDPGFRPALSAVPGPIAPLADGRVYVSGLDITLDASLCRRNGPVRLLADGTLDLGFTVADGVLLGSPQALVVQPDGRLVVLERTSTSPPTFRSVRLNLNGSLDPTFRPDATMIASGGAPTLLADGRWISVERRSSPGSGTGAPTSIPFVAVLRRFNADGNIDAGFPPVELMTGSAQESSLQLRSAFTGPRIISTTDAQGRIYVGVHHGDFAYSQAASGGTTRLFRLRPDGMPDPTYSPADVGPFYTLVATTSGLVARTMLEGWARLQPIVNVTEVFRLKSDGTRDSTYHGKMLRTQRYGRALTGEIGLGNDYDVLTVLPDGAIIARAVGHLGHFGLVRFDPNGDLDRNFNAELGTDTTAITQVHSLANGQLLVAGTFRSLLGVEQPFLARLTPNGRAATTHLSNVSVRSRTGTAATPLIAGYVTQGGGETSVLARGAGPALSAFGVVDPLADPQLALYFGPALISTNDDWDREPVDFIAATATRLGAFPFAAGSTDSALYTAAPSGAFTLQLTGKNSASGVALAELYHASPAPSDASSPRVINFSVRAAAGTGSDMLIVGFALGGTNTRNVVIRAVGPGLARFGVADSLPDPVLTLFRGATAIATNDDWAPTPESWRSMNEAFNTVGAFPFEYAASTFVLNASKDSALLISLVPGSYTVQVRGKNSATGAALVEIYEVP